MEEHSTGDPADRVEEVDVVVVGLGPGGETVAGLVAKAGLDVIGVEERLVGGECPFFGCVPSKMMVSAAGHAAEAARVARGGGEARVAPDFGTVARRIREEATHDWHDDEYVERLTGHGAQVVRGRGRLTGPRTVEVALTGGGTRTLRARRGVVLGTGTEPAVPPVDGLAGTPYWTNQDVARATAAPASLVVLGGGPIGVELAQVFARFGTRVALVEAADRLLGGDEPEAAPLVAAGLCADDVDVRTATEVVAVRHRDGFVVSLGDGGELRAERLLVATGRRTLLDVGLGAVGVEPTEEGTLATDERMRVAGAEGLWAVGDVTGEGAWTHLATYQGRVAARDLLGEDGPWARYHAVPRVTYADPEVAAVGLTEQQARAREDLDVVVATADLGARGWLAQADGLVKLVADRRSGRLVGATVVGPTAGEVLSMLVVAVEHRLPVAALRRTIFAYPTWHRAVETALHRLPLEDAGDC